MATIEEFIGTDVVHQSDWTVNAKGDLGIIKGLKNLKLRLLHRMVTSPGGFIHLPLYGVGIKDFQNSPMTIGNQIQITKRIEEQFLQDPAVETVTGVTFIKDNNFANRLQIIARIQVVGAGDTQFTFTPFGGNVAPKNERIT